MSMRYTVVYEKSRTGWGAYAPIFLVWRDGAYPFPSSGDASNGPSARMSRACEPTAYVFRRRVRWLR